ncbi:DUF1573 domain-containing protein [Gemmata sp. G18]|uniref:DUF1573 domain-containing protein n=1 Tax=Gemmata palustris TaxID=2822762 RepID=A0ABS5BKS5_9BACT|nr:cysteine peptidase family C39 domain-containing protein [Gemmata palustris]MBP3954306.1 DUF1573 domain-containing protein [Gemmata palustris]
MRNQKIGLFALLSGAGIIVACSLAFNRNGRAANAPADCGARSLARVCEADERPVDLDTLRQLTKTTSEGTTLLEIKNAAESLGFEARGVKIAHEDLVQCLGKKRSYAILHLNRGHFVAAIGVAEDGRLNLTDAPEGSQFFSELELRDRGWSGYALLLNPKPDDKSTLKLESDHLDLGKLRIGEEKAFQVQVHNNGDREARIESIEAGCGCINIGAKNPAIGSPVLSANL